MTHIWSFSPFDLILYLVFLQVPAQPWPGVICQPVSWHKHGVTASLGNEVWQSWEGQLSPTFCQCHTFCPSNCIVWFALYLFHYGSQALQCLEQLARLNLSYETVHWRDSLKLPPGPTEKMVQKCIVFVCVCVCVYDFLERSSFIDKGSQIGEVSYNKFSFLVPNVVYKMRVCRCADLTTLNTTKAIMLCGCVDEIASQIVLTFFSVVSAIFHWPHHASHNLHWPSLASGGATHQSWFSAHACGQGPRCQDCRPSSVRSCK